MKSLCLSVLQSELFNCAPETKCFIVMCVIRYGLRSWELNTVHGLADGFKVTRKTVADSLSLLKDKQFLETIELQRIGQPPKKAYKLTGDLIIRLAGLRSDRIPPDLKISDHLYSSICVIAASNAGKDNISKSKKLANSNRLLLMIFLACSNDAGVVTGLGRADLGRLTGMSGDRLDSQLDKLVRLKFISLIIPGTTSPKLFGAVTSAYFLNIKEKFAEDPGLAFSHSFLWSNYVEMPSATNIVVAAGKACSAIGEIEARVGWLDRVSSAFEHELTDMELSWLESQISDECFKLSKPDIYTLTERTYSFRGFRFIPLDLVRKVLIRLSSISDDSVLLRTFQLKLDELASYLLCCQWSNIEDYKNKFERDNVLTKVNRDSDRFVMLTRSMFANKIFCESDVDLLGIDDLRNTFFDLISYEAVKLALFIKLEIHKIFVESKYIVSNGDKYFIYSQYSKKANRLALYVNVFMQCSETQRREFRKWIK
jgi:hypothetical protein